MLLVPAINYPGGGHLQANELVRGVVVAALLWNIQLSYWILYSEIGISIVGVNILNPYHILSSTIMSIVNIIFAIQVIRFCKKQTSKRITIAIGILTLIFPFLIFIPWWSYQNAIQFWERSGLIIYYGPIPILLIIGLIIMRYVGPWKVTKPWEEDETLQGDWWNNSDEKRKEES